MYIYIYKEHTRISVWLAKATALQNDMDRTYKENLSTILIPPWLVEVGRHQFTRRRTPIPVSVILPYTPIYRHIRAYTLIYLHIPSYTAMYLHIHSYTIIYRHIPPYTLIRGYPTILGTRGYATILGTHGYPTTLGIRGCPTISGIVVIQQY